jgi:hypothetical protein
MAISEVLRHRYQPYSRLRVDLVFASVGKVVGLLDLIRPDTLRDSDHPQELVDVVSVETATDAMRACYVIARKIRTRCIQGDHRR